MRNKTGFYRFYRVLQVFKNGNFENDHMSRTKIQCVKDEIINFDELF